MKLLCFVPTIALVAALVGCKDQHQVTDAEPPHRHEHQPPHGGTPVVLGHEEYHLELVRDPVAGKLTAYVMDGELENFIRIPAISFTVVLPGPPPERRLVFQAIANPASGETVGDTSQFEVQADWLKNTAIFDGVLSALTVRNQTFTNVSFNFPSGNDTDEPPKR